MKFRNNLLDIGEDCGFYGTHSFRRGGTQYLSSHKRWPLRKLCDWGGWSADYSALHIVRYLYSWNDDPVMPREDFLKPEQPTTTKCYQCGRSCQCA